MRLLLSTALIPILSFMLQAADITGKWVGAMETPGGTFNLTVAIQSGTPFSGTVTSDMFSAKIENPKRDGDTISFETSIEAGKLTYAGTVAGEEMKLIVTGTTGNKYPVNCKRQK